MPQSYHRGAGRVLAGSGQINRLIVQWPHAGQTGQMWEVDLLPAKNAVLFTWTLGVDCRFKPANPSSRSSVGRIPQGPMDRPSFLLFVRAVLPVEAPEAPSGGLLRLVARFSQKPLAVPDSIVQNGGASS